MKNNRIEIRTTGSLVADQESRKIGGLAIAVESKSELLGGTFYETIKRSAVDDALIKGNDIKLYMNHDSTQGTIARSKFGKGSLRLFVTDRGLEFETELPNTEKGNEVIEGIRRGDIDACSFAMVPDSVTWTELDNDLYQRDINSFKMVDEISILSCLPAYSATEVDMRSLDDFKSYKEKITSPDDNMEEPKTQEYNKRAQEDEEQKPLDEETKAEDEKKPEEEETKAEETDKEKEETKAEDEEKKPEDEEKNAAEDEKPDEEEKSEDEDEKDDEEEDRMLSEYYTSLRDLIK